MNLAAQTISASVADTIEFCWESLQNENDDEIPLTKGFIEALFSVVLAEVGPK